MDFKTHYTPGSINVHESLSRDELHHDRTECIRHIAETKLPGIWFKLLEKLCDKSVRFSSPHEIFDLIIHCFGSNESFEMLPAELDKLINRAVCTLDCVMNEFTSERTVKHGAIQITTTPSLLRGMVVEVF